MPALPALWTVETPCPSCERDMHIHTDEPPRLIADAAHPVPTIEATMPQRANGIDEAAAVTQPSPEDAELARVIRFVEIMPTWGHSQREDLKRWLLARLGQLAHRPA